MRTVVPVAIFVGLMCCLVSTVLTPVGEPNILRQHWVAVLVVGAWAIALAWALHHMLRKK